MFELSENNIHGFHIEANKRVLVVDHGLSRASEANCELLEKLYRIKQCVVTRIKLTYEKNTPLLCDQIGKVPVPLVVVSFPEAGRLTYTQAMNFPYNRGLVASFSVALAAKYSLEVVSFPDIELTPDFQEHTAYAAYTGTSRMVKFHTPFLGKTLNQIIELRGRIALDNAETVTIPKDYTKRDETPAETDKEAV